MKMRRRLIWISFFFCLLVAALAVRPVQAALGIQASEPEKIPKLTADLLFTLTGSALSILGWVIPPVKRWLASRGEWTVAYMVGALFVFAVIYQFVWCGYSFACVLGGWQTTIFIWGTCVAANYLTYKGVVLPEKEKEKAAASLPVTQAEMIQRFRL